MKPLLETIRNDINITDIFVPGKGECKLITYTDDTAFFPTHNRPVRNILHTITHFGKGSGTKSKLTKITGNGGRFI